MPDIEMVDAWVAPSLDDHPQPILHIALLVDGTPHLHVMPVDTLETRAAEYDMDPGNVDTLLDLVLAEPYLSIDPEHPDYLFNAPDRRYARDRHVARARTVAVIRQSAVKRINERGEVEPRAAGEPTPRDKVKALAVIDPEVVTAKAELIEHHRAARRADREQRQAATARAPRRLPAEGGEMAVASASERAEAIRKLLPPKENSQR